MSSTRAFWLAVALLGLADCATLRGGKQGGTAQALYNGCFSYIYKSVGCDGDGPSLCKDKGFDRFSSILPGPASDEWLIQRGCPKRIVESIKAP